MNVLARFSDVPVGSYIRYPTGQFHHKVNHRQILNVHTNDLNYAWSKRIVEIMPGPVEVGGNYVQYYIISESTGLRLAHRANGPAYTRMSREEWWYYGELHRINGPAITDKDGYRRWYINGTRYDDELSYWVAVEIYIDKQQK